MVPSVATGKVPSTTPPGIDPETVGLVAQCLNRYTTPGPVIYSVRYYLRFHVTAVGLGMYYQRIGGLPVLCLYFLLEVYQNVKLAACLSQMPAVRDCGALHPFLVRVHCVMLCTGQHHV
jgi:hypothetical protein